MLTVQAQSSADAVDYNGLASTQLRVSPKPGTREPAMGKRVANHIFGIPDVKKSIDVNDRARVAAGYSFFAWYGGAVRKSGKAGKSILHFLNLAEG